MSDYVLKLKVKEFSELVKNNPTLIYFPRNSEMFNVRDIQFVNGKVTIIAEDEKPYESK